MKCPQCETEMRRTFRYGIEVDYCPKKHGIWLDHGELQKLIDRAIAEREQGIYYEQPPYKAHSHYEKRKRGPRSPGTEKRKRGHVYESDEVGDIYSDNHYQFRPTTTQRTWRKKGKHLIEEMFDEIFDVFD